MTDGPARPDDELYDPAEVGRRLGFSKEYVLRQIREGRLECVRFGPTAVRIRPSQLEAFLTALEERP